MDWLESVDKRIIFSVEGTESESVYPQVVAAKIIGVTQPEGGRVILWIAPLKLRGDGVCSKTKSIELLIGKSFVSSIKLKDSEEKGWTDIYGEITKVY
jgi:hypothetical protein